MGMNNRSFGRAVYESKIHGPEGVVSDSDGTVLPPVIDVVTINYPLSNGESIVADFPRERTLGVVSVAGTDVGKVTDFQH